MNPQKFGVLKYVKFVHTYVYLTKIVFDPWCGQRFLINGNQRTLWRKIILSLYAIMVICWIIDYGSRDANGFASTQPSCMSSYMVVVKKRSMWSIKIIQARATLHVCLSPMFLIVDKPFHMAHYYQMFLWFHWGKQDWIKFGL